MCYLSVTVFRPIAFICIFSQIVNPVLALFETYNQAEVEAGIYEDNWEYYTRNGLTTIALTTLCFYAITTGHYVSQELRKIESFKTAVCRRVLILCALMVVVLLLRLVMIWTSNYFWYYPSQTGWLVFLGLY
jgi:hypothetical protein